MRGKGTSGASRRVLWMAVGCLWLGVLATGMSLLAWHENSPGSAGDSPSQWPLGSQIPHNEDGDTLVMFAHPRCPCTRASLGELERIVSRYPGDATAWVVYLKPSETDCAWSDTDQRATAASLRGVQVLDDLDGAEARRFHATTSGQTLLYDRDGKLQFSGGITSARGHAGDNAGRCAVETILSGSLPDRHTSPVFGCPLFNSSEQD